MNSTIGQFKNKIDEFVPNLAICTLRLLNAMFDWGEMWFVNKTNFTCLVYKSKKTNEI